MWWGDDHVIHSLINLSRMFFKLSTGTRSLRSIWRLYRKNLCNSLLYYSLTMQCNASHLSAWLIASFIISGLRNEHWPLSQVHWNSPGKKIYYIANIKTPFITHNKKQYCPKKKTHCRFFCSTHELFTIAQVFVNILFFYPREKFVFCSIKTEKKMFHFDRFTVVQCVNGIMPPI